MTLNQSQHSQGNYWRILVLMFLSFVPILSVAFAICYGVGFVLAGLLYVRFFYVAGMCFLVMAAILAQILGALSYRFFARAFPLKAPGESDLVALRFMKLILVAMIAACLGLSVLGGTWIFDLMELYNLPNIGESEGLQAALLANYLHYCLIFLLFFACFSWSLIKVIKFHRRPDAWASKGFILFLRTFGAVSDSAALSLLISGSGVHSRIALLSSPKEIMTSWDPMTLAVAGFSLRHPFHSVPVYLESTESSWVDDVRRLAISANIVVIDISHRSPGISLEMEILNELGLEEKTIQFEETLESDVRAVSLDFSRGVVVSLKQSRFRRRISQVFIFTFTYLGFSIFAFLASGAVDLIWGSQSASLVLKSLLLLFVIPTLYSSLTLSPAAGFTRKSAATLVQAIQQKVHTRYKISNFSRSRDDCRSR